MLVGENIFSFLIKVKFMVLINLKIKKIMFCMVWIGWLCLEYRDFFRDEMLNEDIEYVFFCFW